MADNQLPLSLHPGGQAPLETGAGSNGYLKNTETQGPVWAGLEEGEGGRVGPKKAPESPKG